MRALAIGGLVLALAAPLASGKVDEQQAARLGKDLTPTGAERAGNADGSIPAWSGKIIGVPPGVTYAGPGTVYPDPYAGEKPLFSITAQNVEQYAARLSEGQKALFRTYPKTFRMDVYPTHRDFGVTQDAAARARHNALNAELYNGDDGVNGYTGGIPFPIPTEGAHPIWNSRLSEPAYHMEGLTDDVVVYPDGRRSTRRGVTHMKVLFSDPAIPVGADFKTLSKYSAFI